MKSITHRVKISNVDFKISSSVLTLESFTSSKTFSTILFIYLVNQRFFQISAMFSISSLFSNFDSFNSFRDIDFFNSNLFCSDSKIRQFNDVTSFLRNLEHCQKLYQYRKTKLLEYRLWTLNDFAWEWYKKQSHFNFLSRFDMILTKAFSSQEQRKLKSIIQKRTKRKVRKIEKRIELKIMKTTKQTSTLQNIDIFDSILTFDKFEFELYNETAIFLQHFQQCRHLYRKSNLLNLLLKWLCDFASEWFKIQFEFNSLKRFNKILTKAFSFAKTSSKDASSKRSNFQLSTFDVISESIKNLSNFKVTCVRVICKLCKQSFNFNKKLYEHIRNHETLKLVKNSHLSINAVNLVCEIEKKSFVTHVSFASLAKSQKSIFEFATTFKTIILLKRSILSFLILKTISKSMKSTSMQCFSASSISSSRIVVLKSSKISESKISIFCSFLTSFTFETICHFSEKSIVTLFLFASLDIFNSIRSHQNSEKKRFNQIVIFIQHF